tara:strand:+ start:798 stop:1514 length:717 start_codon:yes stop_codon:yes gene_type:complete
MENTSFSIYNHVATEPLLSREEEVMLSKRIEKGDQSARDRMIKANMRLALSVVKRYTNRGVDTDDLVQESIIGLTRAVDQFDWKKGFKFSTYAYWWIQQAVRQCIASNTGPIALPANTFSKLYKIGRFEKDFNQEFGRPPTDEETAQKFGTTTDTLRSLRQSAARPRSFDTPMYSDDSGSRTLKDVLPSSAPSPEEMIDNARMSKTIRDTLSTLTERERTIIAMRFGLDNLEDSDDNA